MLLVRWGGILDNSHWGIMMVAHAYEIQKDGSPSERPICGRGLLRQWWETLEGSHVRCSNCQARLKQIMKRQEKRYVRRLVVQRSRRVRARLRPSRYQNHPAGRV